eukprot:7319667-Pyramimonas_sp.AAC.1
MPNARTCMLRPFLSWTTRRVVASISHWPLSTIDFCSSLEAAEMISSKLCLTGSHCLWPNLAMSATPAVLMRDVRAPHD